MKTKVQRKSSARPQDGLVKGKEKAPIAKQGLPNEEKEEVNQAKRPRKGKKSWERSSEFGKKKL